MTPTNRKATNSPPQSSGKLHLDKRAGAIAAAVAAEGVDDDLLSTRELALWLGVTPTWLEIGRYKNYGPGFVRLAPQVVRYRRSAVLAWLKQREFVSTAQYASPRRVKAEA